MQTHFRGSDFGERFRASFRPKACPKASPKVGRWGCANTLYSAVLASSCPVLASGHSQPATIQCSTRLAGCPWSTSITSALRTSSSRANSSCPRVAAPPNFPTARTNTHSRCSRHPLSSRRCRLRRVPPCRTARTLCRTPPRPPSRAHRACALVAGTLGGGRGDREQSEWRVHRAAVQ